MKRNDLIGYLLGLTVFVLVIPLGMWAIAGRPAPGGAGNRTPATANRITVHRR